MKRMLLCLLLTFLIAAQIPDRAEVQLQSAIKLEVRDGNLKAAIEQYNRIISSKDASRTVKAKALLQLGGCYEKQGNAEARKVFERIIKEFSDQSEVANLARIRTSMLATAIAPQTSRLVYRQLDFEPSEEVDLEGPSPDGKYMAYYDNTGFCVYDLVQRKRRTLVPDDPKYFLFLSLWSPDSSSLAFTKRLRGSATASIEIKTVDVNGAKERSIYVTEPSLPGSVDLCGWFPDGKALFVSMPGIGFARLSIQDGSIQKIGSERHRERWNATLSPDGKRFVASRSAQNAFSIVISTVGVEMKTREVYRDTGTAQLVGWSASGSSVLFQSDRGGSFDLWQIGIDQDKPEPELVKSNIGNVYPLGGIRGSYFFEIPRNQQDIQVASVDWSTGKLTSQPKRVNTRHIGSSTHPIWSPDGERLAFLSRTNSDERPYLGTLTLCSMKDGSQREFRLQEKLSPYHLAWSADGKFIFGSSGIPYKFVQINTFTGETTAHSVDNGYILNSAAMGRWFFARHQAK